jgi:hypothetical protein
MSAATRTQDKSTQPEGLENKALTDTTEVKAADPGVKVEFVGHLSAGYIGDKAYNPGETASVHPQVAHDLIVAGVAKRAD